MKRTLSTALAAASLVLVTVGLAQPAQAITNPADNPRPITVKGDDGKTYHDGEDTLPGYDDEACTYIPGAYFDFDNNKVRYADGQSIPWTEWDRATGYKEWKAKQSKPTAAPTTAAPKPAKTTAPKAKSTPKPAASRSTSKPGTSKSGTSKAAPAKATPSATAAPTTDESAADPAPSSSDDATPPASSEAATTDGSTPAPEATDAVEDVTLAADSTEKTSASAREDDGTGSAGLLILAGLAGAGALAYAAYTVAARRKGSTT